MVDGGGDSGEVGERRGAPLEPVGDVVRRRRQLERVDALEQRGVGHQAADVRAVPLVGAGDVEVRAELGDVDDPVRGAVHPVDVGQCPDGVRRVRDRPDVGTRAEHVARPGHRHHPGALVEQVAELLGRQLAGLDVDPRPPHLDTGRLGPLHPGPHVGVVVELGDHDVVPWLPLARHRLREPVRERRHVRSEHHPGRISRTDQVGDSRAGGVRDVVGRPTAGEGSPAVAGARAVGVGDRLDDRRRRLRAGGTVEPDPTVPQRRVERPDSFDVVSPSC